MTARRKPAESAGGQHILPNILTRGPRALFSLVPDAFNKGPQDFRTYTAARQIMTVARARWYEAKGWPVMWRMPGRYPGEQPIPAALRKAGEDLADGLLRQ